MVKKRPNRQQKARQRQIQYASTQLKGQRKEESSDGEDLTDDTAPGPSGASTSSNSLPDPKPFGRLTVIGSTYKPVPLPLVRHECAPGSLPSKVVKNESAKNKDNTRIGTISGSAAKVDKAVFQPFVVVTYNSETIPRLSKRARKRAAAALRAEKAKLVMPWAVPNLEPIKETTTTSPQPQPKEDIMDRNAMQWGPGANNYQKGVAGIPKSFLIAAEAQSQARLQNEQAAQTKSRYETESSANTAYNFPEVYRGFNDAATLQQNEPETVVIREGSKSPQFGEKRPSAFDRLGPVTQPKKPKLTINLLFSKETASGIREVINIQNKEKVYVPVHKREEVLSSSHEVILKYLAVWPWKVEVHTRKTAGPRDSKTAMLMEEEQMTEYYETPTIFIKVLIKNCPKEFEKEDALDLILDQLKDYSFIPTFIDMANGDCTFLVTKCSGALLALHKCGLRIPVGEQSLDIFISATYLKHNMLNFVPKLVLRKMVLMAYDEDKKSLNLQEFSLQPDISNFIYFPLNRVQNQIELLQLQSVQLNNLVELNLSRNRLTTIDGFNLGFTARRLKRLDLSFNYLEKMTTLLPCRNLLLENLRLEGNPLCNDYTDPESYKKTAFLLFPCLKELDGIKIVKPGNVPRILQTYCPLEAKDLIEKFLHTFFPILDSSEDRLSLSDMYHPDAVMTITFRSRLRSASIFRYGREMFSRARCLEEGNKDEINGAKAIAKNYARWPKLKHDAISFNVDVLLHEEYTTIFRVGGIMKAASEKLADDEHLLAFTRTLVIHSKDGVEYTIHNEMLHFDEPSRQCLEKAFQVNTVTRPRLVFDSNPDAAVKEGLVVMLSDLTELGKKQSERCLSQKNWDLRAALEYFMALLKLNSLNALDED